MKIGETIKKIFKFLVITIMMAAICVSGYNLWKMSERYVQETQVKDSIAKYRPLIATASTTQPTEYCAAENTETAETETTEITKVTEAGTATQPEKSTVNQSIIDLQDNVNKDIVGWINIPNTHIDYPFVISKDDNDYLRRDLHGNYALSGTVFMDYRCSKDFTDFNTIIYGHNMKNNSMFGDLTLFADEGFFNSNRTGTIFLADRVYTLEFFAYMTVNANDKIIYNTAYTPEQRGEYFEYVKKAARNYIDIDNINNANILTLSTCSYQFDGARAVLLAAIIHAG
ncbi:MAG: class B sortase [Oscillospiraceae bacterium]|nr:class B sortase [Oscillospiraceae bacterium]